LPAAIGNPAQIHGPPVQLAAHAAPAEPSQQPAKPLEISFSSVLATVSGQNPQVAFADERIREAFAQYEAARVLWLPSIRAGVSYNRHDGTLQAVDGEVGEVSRSAMESGLGIGAAAAGSPLVPGVFASFRLADAVFLPRAAGHVTTARQSAATATTHDILLSAALGYLDLLRAFQQLAIAEETLQHAQQLADTTAAFARTGQGSQADADRAEAELALRNNELARARESTRVASARLTELLSLDPAGVLVPQEPTVVPIDLVTHEIPLSQLVAQALSNRPELAESRDLVSAALDRLRREQYAPLIPSVLLGVSYGGFGGGRGDSIANYRDRVDLDAGAYWELRNLGLGERAARDGARSRLQQARLRQVQLMDQVAREVVEAHAQAESRRNQIAVAESGVKAAAASYQRNIERIRNARGLPLEALQSIQALDQSRREYLRAVADYNEAQFRLHRALGWPIQP